MRSRRPCEAPQRRRRVRADRARPVTARSPMIRPPDGAASVRTGLAKHPGATGACGQTAREVSNVLHGPRGILRNQETMQAQHFAYGRGEATHQKCFAFPNTLMKGCFAPTTIRNYPIPPALRSTPAPQARVGRPSEGPLFLSQHGLQYGF